MRGKWALFALAVVVVTAGLAGCASNPQLARLECEQEFMRHWGVPINLSSDLLDRQVVREWYRSHPACLPHLVAEPPPPPPTNDVNVRPLTCLRSGSGPLNIVIQAPIQNVSAADIAPPFTVTLESLTINGQPSPNLTTTVPVTLLAGAPPISVPALGDWTVTIPAFPVQLAATVTVRKGAQVIGQRLRACMVS